MKGTWLVDSVETDFGDSVTIRQEEQLVLVCTNNGTGWKPRSVLLPHQVYKQKVEAWLKEDPSIFEVACFPLRHDGFTSLWRAA